MIWITNLGMGASGVAATPVAERLLSAGGANESLTHVGFEDESIVSSEGNDESIDSPGVL